MADRISKTDFTKQLAERMGTKDEVAAEWLEGVIETLYDNFKAGKGVTLPGFGSFYVRPNAQPGYLSLARPKGCGRCSAGLPPIMEKSNKLNGHKYCVN